MERKVFLVTTVITSLIVYVLHANFTVILCQKLNAERILFNAEYYMYIINTNTYVFNKGILTADTDYSPSFSKGSKRKRKIPQQDESKNLIKY